ncbi:hypothetical protein M378DRAFT_28484 [Amanita muscaria Koide BX008]|uniref:Uncharacterized protein n=1 Tax=Amanita muscaria (strain Koide BX008) TaxID=946122 RepID=A0A0C2WI91_AMAMK|nr:hypothetical protein M378DRAFT_28484 [Amanita muscaria Koide BX008]
MNVPISVKLQPTWPLYHEISPAAIPHCRCPYPFDKWSTDVQMFILPALLAICIRVASKLSQPLVRPTPPAFACYPPSHPSGDCTDVLSHLDDGSWRDNLLGAMQSINFESFTFNNGTIDASYYNTTLGYPVTFRSSESTRRRLPIFSQSVPSFYDAYLAFFNVTGQVGGTNEFVSRLVSLEINRRKCPKWPWEFLTV